MRRIKPKHAEDEAFFRTEYAMTLAQRPELEFIVDADDELGAHFARGSAQPT